MVTIKFSSTSDAHNTDDLRERHRLREHAIVSPNMVAMGKEKSRVRIAYFQQHGVIPDINQLIQYANRIGYNTNGW